MIRRLLGHQYLHICLHFTQQQKNEKIDILLTILEHLNNDLLLKMVLLNDMIQIVLKSPQKYIQKKIN